MNAATQLTEAGAALPAAPHPGPFLRRRRGPEASCESGRFAAHGSFAGRPHSRQRHWRQHSGFMMQGRCAGTVFPVALRHRGDTLFHGWHSQARGNRRYARPRSAQSVAQALLNSIA